MGLTSNILKGILFLFLIDANKTDTAFTSDLVSVRPSEINISICHSGSYSVSFFFISTHHQGI